MTAMIAITGAGGYLGRHLLAHWSERGERLVAIGRGGDLAPRNVSWQAVDWAQPPSLIGWRQYLRGCDTVVHTAARVHAQGAGANDAAAFERDNVTLTETVVRAALDVGVRHFIHISSVAVHGDAPAGVLHPGSPLLPDTPYGHSKLRAEQRLQALAAGSAMALTLLRPPLIYGPSAPGNMARLAAWACSGRPLPLGAVRRNRRSLLSINNLLACIDTCWQTPPDAAQGARVVLPCDGAPLSTRAMIDALADGAGVTPRLLDMPPALLRLALRATGRARMARQLLDDLEIDPHSMAVIGFQPAISSVDGLRALGASYNAGHSHLS